MMYIGACGAFRSIPVKFTLYRRVLMTLWFWGEHLYFSRSLPCFAKKRDGMNLSVLYFLLFFLPHLHTSVGNLVKIGLLYSPVML